MKKLSIVLLVLGLFIAKSSFAQDDSGELKNFRFGLKIQPSLNWFKPDDAKKMKSDGTKMKFGYGLMTEFRLSKVVCFSTGLEINASGGGLDFLDTVFYKQADTITNFLVTTRTFKVLNYVDIPITLKMKTPEIGTLTYFGQFGVNASIRWNAKSIDKGHLINTPSDIYNKDLEKATKEVGFLQLGLNVGGGFEMNLAGTTSLVVSVNYHNGFTNVLRSESKNLVDKTGSAMKQNVKSKCVSLTVGVLF